MQFPVLVSFPDLFHAVFTRRGGFSAPPFATLNISPDLGDDPGHVARNRERIAECAGGGEPVFMDQVHGTRIWVLKAATADPFPGRTKTPRVDAAVTDIPEKILVVQVADCQPIFLYDPVHRAVANIHAGWRGSIRGIIEKTVHSMNTGFGSLPGDIIACIGPSLGPCCAEFIHYRKEIPSPFWMYKDDQDRFDFWSMSRDQLMQTGLSKANIHISGLCTRCRGDLFFSYRGEKITGRFAAAIGVWHAGRKNYAAGKSIRIAP